MKRKEPIEAESRGPNRSLPARLERALEPVREPEFRIDARDLEFLRSIGIDPTRRLKSRRARR